MAYTLAQLDAVEAALASGRLTVKVGQRQVTYQSAAALTRLRDQMRAELGVSPPEAARGRAWLPVTGSGL